jgi:hypothetical protein
MHHSVERVDHTIEMDESLNLHIRGWTIQRIGWAVFMMFVILALLGFFGNGVLSHRKTQTAGSTVEYERYGRYENTTHLHFIAANDGGQAVVYIPQQYLEDFQLEHITPEPDRQMMVEGHYAYTFLADAPVHILMRGMPKKSGAIEAVVRINNTPFRLSQYIFP